MESVIFYPSPTVPVPSGVSYQAYVTKSDNTWCGLAGGCN